MTGLRCQNIGNVTAVGNSRVQVGIIETHYHTGIDPLSRLPSAPEAAFNSIDQEHQPLCMENTRVAVLDEINTWVHGHHDTCILWLSGAAGTGKSTIARTVCRKFHNEKLLGASFFFSRGKKNRSDARCFFTTLAKELALRYPELKAPISNAVEAHPDVDSWLLRDQWTILIAEPLQTCTMRAKVIVILVDALDECEQDASIQHIISLLFQANDITNVMLRMIVTSRPEMPVRTEFRKLPILHRSLILDDVPRDVADADIRRYLQCELSRICDSSPKDGWPGMEIIDQLVDQSAGSFIYAATVCLWIAGEDELIPEESLLNFVKTPDMDRQPTPDHHITGQIDQLYLQVLQQSIKSQTGGAANCRLRERIQAVLGWIAVLQEPTSLSSLSLLVEYPAANIKHWLRRLHSVVRVPDDDLEILQFYHTSFRDFLLDPRRCTDPGFLVVDGPIHSHLARQSLKLLSTSGVLHQDMCKVQFPDTEHWAVEKGHVDKEILRHVRYACKNWVHHTLFNDKEPINDGSEVYQFLRTKFLYWIEVMIRTEQLSEAVAQISQLDLAALNAFLNDAKRFILHNRALIDFAPLQLYASALIFTPRRSIVRKMFSNHIPRWIVQLPRVSEYWRSELIKLELFPSTFSLRFSHDGKFLACISDQNITVWNTHNWKLEQTFLGNFDYFDIVRFSPDNKLLSRISRHRTIESWDIASGEHRYAISAKRPYTWLWRCLSPDGEMIAGKERQGPLFVYKTGSPQQEKNLAPDLQPLGFSPDNRLLATIHPSGQIYIVDLEKVGEEMQPLGVHIGAHGACFSQDGKLAAIQSNSKTEVWDISGKKQVWTSEDHGLVAKVRFAPGRQHIALAYRDWIIRIFNVESGKCLAALEGHTGTISDMCYFPDGDSLATASEDGTVRIWTAHMTAIERDNVSGWISDVRDLRDGETALASWSHDASILGTWFSRDHKLIASARHDGTVEILSAQSKQVVRVLCSKLYVRRGPRCRISGCFSPGGRLLAAAFHEDQVIVWNLVNGLEIGLSLLAEKCPAWIDFTTTDTLPDPDLDPRPDRQDILDPQYVEDISLDGSWIVADGVKRIYLPYEWRTGLLEVKGNIISVEEASGFVTSIHARTSPVKAPELDKDKRRILSQSNSNADIRTTDPGEIEFYIKTCSSGTLPNADKTSDQLRNDDVVNCVTLPRFWIPWQYDRKIDILELVTPEEYLMANCKELFEIMARDEVIAQFYEIMRGTSGSSRKTTSPANVRFQSESMGGSSQELIVTVVGLFELDGESMAQPHASFRSPRITNDGTL
ncbi:hypothetical protein K461DRAFT_33938 [Myriangium duriaei CBS 260.36]|uniref:NACHT domain-containing protein n=1 Tax=Myriangium duriaei CBS 260.36 TaxID=1168546 RepID=A0A9P4MH96_9PEZI|nr:hypothetical protein K461DRAFT_33938 [Myriangium duriaei CBS 260.36]